MKSYNKILEAVNRGILIALDDYEDIESNNSIFPNKDIINNDDAIRRKIDLNKYTVDLGLPSGTLWCKYNLGVDPNKLSNPEDWYGDYYAWGETIPNKPDGYDEETYQFKNLTKYNKEDHLTELQLIDDAAYLNMHLYNFKFRMPTKEDFEELIDETINEWVENFNNSGVNGYKFTNKSDHSKYIFLPAASFLYAYSNLTTIGIEGYYLSSSLDIDCPNSAWNLCFNNRREVSMHSCLNYGGHNVRPVFSNFTFSPQKIRMQ